MSDISNEALAGILLLLIVLSGFFSSSETGLMAINRVRLQHQAEEGSKAAARILSLLDRPDRLIGLILIGNNFVNIWPRPSPPFLLSVCLEMQALPLPQASSPLSF